MAAVSAPANQPPAMALSAGGRERAARDLLLLAAAVLLFYAISIQLELAERLNAWFHGYERWQLDEIPLTLLALCLGLLWFGARRWWELNREIAMRRAAEARHLQLLDQNRRLAQQLIAMQESERRHIARELHDDIGQCCVAIQFDAALVAREVPQVDSPIHASAQRISAMARQLQDVLRVMLQRLRPIGLDDLGLLGSVQIFVDGWQQRHGIACSFHCALDAPKLQALDDASTLTLYRGVQEGLTNIARHAEASQVQVELREEGDAARPERLVLSVSDNGRGLPLGRAGAPLGLGLLGMQERVHALGGSLSLSRLAAAGTRLQLQLPLHAAQEAA